MKIEDMSLEKESIRGAISGIDGIDSLLVDAGYSEESSTRLHLAIVRSLLWRVVNANEKAVTPLTDSQEGSADRFGDRDVVPANFARELELRIAELEKENQDLKIDCKATHKCLNETMMLNTELEEYKSDIEETTKIVMSEKCADDEVHCTCVPVLRQKVRELEEYKLHNYDPAESIRLNSGIMQQKTKIAELEKQVEELKDKVEQIMPTLKYPNAGN
jgi:uncharacterized coiled-coil protein SlyX